MRNTPRIARVGKVGWRGLGAPGGLRLPWDGEGGSVGMEGARTTLWENSGCGRRSYRVCKCSVAGEDVGWWFYSSTAE